MLPHSFTMGDVRHWDVVVIGGGVIGLSLSIALRKKGATVLVVERGEPGREASHAAGGMLVDCPVETPAPLQALATASAAMYPEFVHELQLESGLPIDLRDYGTIVFPAPGKAHEWAGIQRLSSEEQNAVEAAIAPTDRPAFLLKERSVEPRGLMAALTKYAKHRGVDISSGDTVTGLTLTHGVVAEVTTHKTAFACQKVVNCAGAWAGQIGPVNFPTRPAKGQMLAVVPQARNLLAHVIRSPEAYVIPRSDGRIVIGTTLEDAGFDKRTDPAVIQRLYRSAVAWVPELAQARILEDWAGLRPATPDGLPILGQTGIPNYFVATGHYRDGILLAPVTAAAMAEVINGSPPAFDLTAFSPARFA